MVQRIVAAPLRPVSLSKRNDGAAAVQIARMAEAAVIILGTMMLQNALVFLLSGNTQPEDIAAAAAHGPAVR